MSFQCSVTDIMMAAAAQRRQLLWGGRGTALWFGLLAMWESANRPASFAATSDEMITLAGATHRIEASRARAALTQDGMAKFEEVRPSVWRVSLNVAPLIHGTPSERGGNVDGTPREHSGAVLPPQTPLSPSGCREENAPLSPPSEGGQVLVLQPGVTHTADKPRTKRPARGAPKGEDPQVKALVDALYFPLKASGALPPDPRWWWRQMAVAPNLLKAHPLVEWEACIAFGLADAYHCDKCKSLSYIANNVWPQYALRGVKARASPHRADNSWIPEEPFDSGGDR